MVLAFSCFHPSDAPWLPSCTDPGTSELRLLVTFPVVWGFLAPTEDSDIFRALGKLTTSCCPCAPLVPLVLRGGRAFILLLRLECG